MIKFSIIIPVYNVRRYLGDALDSVLSQTETSWECICVDDGSTDGSGAILDGYAAKDPRFKVMHQENQGVGASRNVAIRMATGKWICFLDPDDILSTSALSCFYRCVLECPEADLVRYRVLRFNDGERIGPAARPETCRLMVRHIGHLISKSDVQCGTFVRYACRRDVHGDVFFDEGLLVGEDRKYSAELFSRAKICVDIDAVGYWYRRRPGSVLLSRMTLEKLKSSVRYIYDVYDAFRRSGKRIEDGIGREFGQHIGEQLVYEIYQLGLEDQGAGWQLFWEATQRLWKVVQLTRWQSFSIGLCRLTHSKIVAIILLYVPRCLKLRGIHR